MSKSMSNVYPHGPEFALRLFSSHSWAYGFHRDGLHDLIAPEWIKGIDFHDISVPKAHPLHFGNDHDLLVELLAQRIASCDAVLIMAGIYASHSYWIDVEARLAHQFGKPILAIAPNGQERLSATATRYSEHEVVRWRGNSVRSAILQVIEPQVRRDFLAAKLWRQKIHSQQVRTQNIMHMLRARKGELYEVIRRAR